MNDFEELMTKLDRYEEELNRLWESYNPEDPDLKIELIGLKMSMLFYKYIVDCFQLINDGFVDKYLAKIRKCLVVISYLCSGVTIFVNPLMTPPAFFGSLYLSFKNKRDNMKMTKLLNDEQSDILFDRIDYLEETYVDKTDAIMDRTLLYEDSENIDNLEEPEKTKRMMGMRLMDAVKSNSRVRIENENQASIIKDIIKSSLNTDSDDLSTLISQAKTEYNQLANSMIKLNKKDARLERINRLFY